PAGIDLLDRTAHYDAIVRNAAIVHRLSTGINDFSGNSLVFHWCSVSHFSSTPFGFVVGFNALSVAFK
ncbi:MAG: hypothetical protein PHI85_11370, partial [Victivallaceae bacterium]|nr:hypothetical protein [Victivallaceae bacterium]